LGLWLAFDEKKPYFRRMTELTRSEKMLAEKTVCILLVRGEDTDGGPIFAYVAVRADKLDAFMEAQKSETFFPEDYGMIIESGEGEPCEEVKTKMRDEYGFQHEDMVDIQNSEHAEHLRADIVKKDPKHPDNL
jgi:hypothetical protein